MTETRAFAPSGGSVAEARRFVVEAIADASTEVKESVALMVSELATNALVHAATGFDVSVERSDRTVRVAVRDRGDGGTPTLQAPPSSEPHGRGLRVVDAMSDEWGVDTTWDRGKTVWFRLSIQPDRTAPATDEPGAARSVGSGGRTAAPGRTASDASRGGRSSTAPRPQARHPRTRQSTRSS